jgi:hypothetical protein
MQVSQEYVEQLDLHSDPRYVPLAFDASMASNYPAAYKPSTYAHNSYYNNPGVFDFSRAVRSSARPGCCNLRPDNMLARMYNTIDNIPEDLMINPIPDPTFMARMPIFDAVKFGGGGEGGAHYLNDTCNQRVCH